MRAILAENRATKVETLWQKTNHRMRTKANDKTPAKTNSINKLITGERRRRRRRKRYLRREMDHGELSCIMNGSRVLCCCLVFVCVQNYKVKSFSQTQRSLMYVYIVLPKPTPNSYPKIGTRPRLEWTNFWHD